MNYVGIIERVLNKHYGWEKTNKLINSDDFPISGDWNNLEIFLKWLRKKVPEKEFIILVEDINKIIDEIEKEGGEKMEYEDTKFVKVKNFSEKLEGMRIIDVIYFAELEEMARRVNGYLLVEEDEKEKKYYLITQHFIFRYIKKDN